MHGEARCPPVAQRLVPGRGRLRPRRPTAPRRCLDRLHRHAALGAHRQPAPRRRRRTARPASGGSCTAAAPSRTGTAPGCAGASPATVRPWPVTPMKRTRPSSRASTAASQRAALAQRGVPLDRVDEVVQLEQVDLVDAEPLERAVDLLAGGRVVRSPVLVARKKRLGLAPQPRREAQLRVAVARRGVDVVDAVLEQHVERAVGLALRDARARRRRRSSACSRARCGRTGRWRSCR